MRYENTKLFFASLDSQNIVWNYKITLGTELRKERKRDKKKNFSFASSPESIIVLFIERYTICFWQQLARYFLPKTF